MDALVAEISEIAAIPSPTFGEDARLEWIARRLRDSPGECRRDSVGNLVWSWGDGRPVLLVTAHVDTVFPASTPLDIERHGDRLIGPGVGDNAAAIAVVLEVVERLLGSQQMRSGAVAFTVGEEGLGNLRGARRVCADLEPEAVVALEGHGLETVVADAHGSVRARVTVTGPGGHSWTDRGRPSAIHELLRIGASAVNGNESDAHINVGVISGGLSVNAIAAGAELLIEQRSTDADQLATFVAYLSALRCEPPLELSVEIMGERPAGTLPRDNPLLQTVRSVRARLGLEDVLESGSTDANAAMGLGIPALSLGISRGRDMHTVHESIEISSLALGARQLELVITSMLIGKQ